MLSDSALSPMSRFCEPWLIAMTYVVLSFPGRLKFIRIIQCIGVVRMIDGRVQHMTQKVRFGTDRYLSPGRSIIFF